MRPAIFYHIVTPGFWQQFAGLDYYEAPSLYTEGFIHASKGEQVEATLNRYYKNEQEVLLLKIEASMLVPELKYEVAPSVNQEFPHIYGRLNKDAIVEILPLAAAEGGGFAIADLKL